MIDLSFTGGSITIKSGVTGATNIPVTEFSDEGSPIEVDEIEVAGYAINLNGLMIRWRKPAAYVAKVTVIPGSDNDESLTKLLNAAHITKGATLEPIANLKVTMEVSAPGINGAASRTWTFEEGCIVSGSPAVASDAEGKMQAKTFTFAFEKMTLPESKKASSSQSLK